MQLELPPSRLRSQNSVRSLDSNDLEAQVIVSLAFRHSNPYQSFVSGFLHLWAIYVNGFDARFHCQKALRGRISSRIKTQSTPINTELRLDEVQTFDSIYLCGVAKGPISSRSRNNLQLPLEAKLGKRFTYRTYNGYEVSVENASLIQIPMLPASWNDLPESYTRCCNFRFGVHRFGYPTRDETSQ
jgi:hypothetical protein